MPSTLIKRKLFCFSNKDFVLVQDNIKKYMENTSIYRKEEKKLSLIFSLPKKVGLEKLVGASFPPVFNSELQKRRLHSSCYVHFYGTLKKHTTNPKKPTKAHPRKQRTLQVSNWNTGDKAQRVSAHTGSAKSRLEISSSISLWKKHSTHYLDADWKRSARIYLFYSNFL